MIKKILKIILSAGFTFGFITVSLADTVLLRVGSGHPSKPTAYVTNMEKVLVPNIKKRVAAELNIRLKLLKLMLAKLQRYMKH